LIKTNTGREKINVNGAYNPVNQEVVCIEHEENVNQQSNMKLVDKIIKESFTDLWLRRRRKEGCQYETKAISIAFNFIPFNFTILGIGKCD
jgi:hypothetical protein